jgi:hypothetical protein
MWEGGYVWCGVSMSETPVPAGGKTFGLRDIWQSPRAHSVKKPGELRSVRPVPPAGPPYKSKCYFWILRGNPTLVINSNRDRCGAHSSSHHREYDTSVKVAIVGVEVLVVRWIAPLAVCPRKCVMSLS